MAKPELLISISSLSKKIDILLEEKEFLERKIKELENVNEELVRQQALDVSNLQNAQKEIEFLKLSHRLAATPEALVAARKEISRLIRTIDSCIRILKED